jgi:phage terminase small subunit
MSKETSKEKEAKKYLNQRQARFVQEYMKTNNITQSAIKAGYSPKTAHVQGCNLLKNIKIVNYIDAINERLESEKIADIQEVMEYLTSVMRGEKKDQFDIDASLSDRTRAAGELAKRLDVRAKSIQVECAVNIIDDIPDSEDIEIEDDLDEKSN